MISVAKDKLLTLGEAAAKLPRKGGKRPHVTTLYRWTTRGVKGVRLEYVQCGATRCTTAEALDAFFAALATRPAPSPLPTPAKLRAADRRERELIEAGF